MDTLLYTGSTFKFIGEALTWLTVAEQGLFWANKLFKPV